MDTQPDDGSQIRYPRPLQPTLSSPDWLLEGRRVLLEWALVLGAIVVVIGTVAGMSLSSVARMFRTISEALAQQFPP